MLTGCQRLSRGILFLTFIYQCITNVFFEVQPTRCNVSRFIYFYKILYMFQAVPPPIIRSTELYIQCQVLSRILLLAAFIDEISSMIVLVDNT